jgi:4-amino-4-deoxy-L-arabinose transferase-like glycosyltransferase
MHCPQASHRVRTVPPTTVEAMDTTTLFPPASATPTATAPPPPTTPARASGEPGRFSRLWRGPESDPSWARPGLLGLLAATAVLLFWGLTASGWSNAFYSAAVQAGSASWKAFFFGSSDAASSITVDKPPASLWVMALSVRALGLSSFSILMPEVLMGVASVAVLHATVKRQFGAAAGLLAGAVLALTPVAVMMFRFDNPDALLVLLMALGAYATLRAIEQASPRWLIWVGVFIGFGFLTKMLQALVVVPAFALAYLVAAPTPLRKRILHLLAAGAAMVVSAGWWIAIVELVPASARPYIGGSQGNSILELTLGYNGLGRITGNEVGSVGGGGGPAGAAGGMWGATGLTRMFNAEIGGQISWLLPSALILLVVGLWARGRMPRTDARRAAYMVWGGWLLVTGLTFSLMAGIFHAYYTIALAPAIGALVGMGGKEAWERRRSSFGSVALAVATAAAAVWSFLLLSRTPDWFPWLRFGVLIVGMAAAFLLLVVVRLHRRAVPLVLAGALVAGLAGPAAYTLSTVSTPHTGSIPTAGPAGQGGMGGPGGFRAAGRGGFGAGPGGALPGGTAGGTAPGGTAPGGGGGMGGLLDASTPSTEVVAALTADSGRYTWVAAAIGSQNAAGLQLATELPVMAIGGFNGSDPSPTLAQFQAMVKAGRIHYFAAGNGRGGPGGGTGGSSAITSWVTASYRAVTIGGSTFYDLTQPTSATGTATGTQS